MHGASSIMFYLSPFFQVKGKGFCKINILGNVPNCIKHEDICAVSSSILYSKKHTLLLEKFIAPQTPGYYFLHH